MMVVLSLIEVFFLKTESAEVIINQLILHGISNDPVGNPFAKA